MVGSIVAVVLGTVAVLAAFVGCVVPVIPGPLLAAAALLAISVPASFGLFPAWVLVAWVVVAVGVQVLDNVLPARAAGKAGAGRPGVWGSVIGMLVGTIILPPFGVFVGAFVGAYVGEVAFNPDNRDPLKAALAVFRGTLMAIILKLAVTGAIAVVFVRGSVRLLG